MKRKFCLSLAVLTTATIFLVNAQQTGKITHSGIGYLEYLPAGYHSDQGKYPVVISLHGIKEKGTSSTDPERVMKDLPKVAYVGLPKYVKQGKKYPFILISPQLKSNHGSWPPSYVIEVLNHVKKTLRIDEKRIYLTGLSLGGLGVWKTAGAYPETFAAIAPICPGGNAMDRASAIAAENVAAWGFHGKDDKIVSYTVTTKMIEAMNSSPKKPNPPAKLTLFSGMGHIIWDKAYHDTNVLDWMLGFRNGSNSSTPPPAANKAPVVNAGSDKTVTLPENALYIEGTASDADGQVVSYKWTKVSGADAGMTATNELRFKAYDLKEGIYVFRLTVEDNDGAAASGEVKVTVKPSENELPLVKAGSDKTLTLPENSIALHGNAEDKDGEIVSYHWTKVAGGNAEMSGAGSAQLSISHLTEGAYAFRLTVKDNDGGSAFDEVKVLVQSPENKPPLAFAGSDKTITSPTQSVNLTGRGEDPDGEVVSYEWTKIAGGSAQLTGVNSNELSISSLEEGEYLFRLSVEDDEGARDFDDVKITVIAEQVSPNDPVDEDTSPVADQTMPDENESPFEVDIPSTSTKWRRLAPPAIPFTAWNFTPIMKIDAKPLPRKLPPIRLK